MIRIRSALPAALLAMAFALPLSVRAEGELPQFRSVLIDGQSRLFSLADATGAGQWLALGDSIDGWKITAFDAAKQMLTITREGATHELTLNATHIAAGEAGKATLAEADALMQKMRFEEMIGKSLQMQQDIMAKSMGDMVGGKNMPAADRERAVAFQKKMMEMMFSEMDIPGMRKDMAQVYSETFSSAELKAQSDFYTTPAGQAMLDKQPVIQQRVAELMMPRMMKAMPKVQAMAKEFAAERRAAKAEAKAEAAGTAPAAPAAVAPGPSSP